MAQNRCYFVNVDYIFNTYAGFIDNNIDPQMIKTFMLLAQDQQMQQLIGYTLFQKYITIITDNTISTDPNLSNYKYLLDNFMVDSISLWTIWFALDNIHYRVTNKSIETKSSPSNSSAADQKALTRLKYTLESSAQFVDTRLRYYILNNPSFYPEYYQTTTAYQLMPKTVTYDNSGNLSLPFTSLGGAGAFGGFGLGGGGGCCGGYVPGFGVPIWGT